VADDDACVCAWMCVCVIRPGEALPSSARRCSREALHAAGSVVLCLHCAPRRLRPIGPDSGSQPTCLGCQIEVYLEPPLSVSSTLQSRRGLLTGVAAPGGPCSGAALTVCW
jgi:hypothetical protein